MGASLFAPVPVATSAATGPLPAPARGGTASAEGDTPFGRDALSPALPDFLRKRELGSGTTTARSRTSARTTAELTVGMTRMGLRAVVEGHTTSAFCVAFDPSGEHAFTGADDGLIKVWHVRSSYLVRTLRGHRSEITDVSIHESGSHLASASNDHTVRIWSLCEEGMPCVAVFPSAPPSSPGSAGAGVAAPIITALWRSIALYRPEHQLLTFTDAGLATLWTKVASDGGAPAPSSPVLHGWTPRSTQLQVKDQSGFEVFDAAWSAAGVRAAVGTSDCLAYILRMNDDHMLRSGRHPPRPSARRNHGAMVVGRHAAGDGEQGRDGAPMALQGRHQAGGGAGPRRRHRLGPPFGAVGLHDPRPPSARQSRHRRVGRRAAHLRRRLDVRRRLAPHRRLQRRPWGLVRPHRRADQGAGVSARAPPRANPAPLAPAAPAGGALAVVPFGAAAATAGGAASGAGNAPRSPATLRPLAARGRDCAIPGGRRRWRCRPRRRRGRRRRAPP